MGGAPQSVGDENTLLGLEVIDQQALIVELDAGAYRIRCDCPRKGWLAGVDLGSGVCAGETFGLEVRGCFILGRGYDDVVWNVECHAFAMRGLCRTHVEACWPQLVGISDMFPKTGPSSYETTRLGDPQQSAGPANH